jgi:hypothetical protein
MDERMSRAEHLAWAKARALEYIDAGNIAHALSSMASDIGKHPETERHPGIQLGLELLISGGLRSQQDARRFIEGFN